MLFFIVFCYLQFIIKIKCFRQRIFLKMTLCPVFLMILVASFSLEWCMYYEKFSFTSFYSWKQMHIQWKFSKLDPQKTDPPWISADFLSCWWKILCKLRKSHKTGHSNSLPAIFLVPVLDGLEKFHCIH
jgi:hypothetical protein